jgi:triacylglycerol esterase/lipase EstA (alpha/beta hydrolase family)
MIRSRTPRGSTAEPTRRRRGWALALAPVVAIAVLCGMSVSAEAAPVPVGGLTEALAAYAFTPKTVPGANDWTCKPTLAHPRPVVLVHGTLENMGFNWAAISPTLKNAGYCVFALNYGVNWLSLDQRANGLTDIAKSAAELKTFVDKVLLATKTAKVDIVGHSQGGLMPNYYIKRLGGAPKVARFIGLAPSNHGTTLSGITALGTQLGLLTSFNLLAAMTAPSLAQQEVGSPFETALFKDGDTVPGPTYVVIATKKDEVVTPYSNGFLAGARNITIQDQCPTDGTGHIGLAFDSPAIQNVLNILGPNSLTFKPVCSGFGIGV